MSMMKLNDIEPQAYEVIYPNGNGELFYFFQHAEGRSREVDGRVQKLHSAEKMQEHAKECVRAALKEYVGPYSDKKANSIILRIMK